METVLRDGRQFQNAPMCTSELKEEEAGRWDAAGTSGQTHTHESSEQARLCLGRLRAQKVNPSAVTQSSQSWSCVLAG